MSFVFAASLLLVILADVLFFRHVIGWTAGLFTAALAAAILARRAPGSAGPARRLLGIVLLGLVVALVEEPTLMAMLVTCIAIVSLAIISREGWTAAPAAWRRRWMRFVFTGWTLIVRDANVSMKWRQRHPATGWGAARGAHLAGLWVLPLLGGALFIALFAWANPIVERWVSRGLDHLSVLLAHLPNLLDPPRILFWGFVLVWTWGLLRVRTRRAWPTPPARLALPPRAAAGAVTTAELQAASHQLLPPSQRGLAVRCLVVFNLVFLIETSLDLFYLWGGRHLPHGLTFKAYAHRGAYPLVLTTLLAAVFVLLMFRRECDGSAWRTARALVYAWLAQNVLLTASAGWRLYLLVNDSNLTRLRLATAFWLALVAFGLLTIVWRIVRRRDNGWLLGVNLATAALVLYACCFLNLDGFIADYNADHCVDVARNGNVLGLTYLRDLGVESIPALDRLSHTLDTPQRRAMAHDLSQELRDTLDFELSDWRGWTWRRSRLRQE